MRSLLLSLMIIGLLFAFAAPAIAENGWQSHNQTATATYLPNARADGAVIPVARFYYGAPGWRGSYGYRYYPRYGAYYNPYYYSYSYPYPAYVYPGPVYGQSYYPYDFYYSGRRLQFGFTY